MHNLIELFLTVFMVVAYGGFIYTTCIDESNLESSWLLMPMWFRIAFVLLLSGPPVYGLIWLTWNH